LAGVRLLSKDKLEVSDFTTLLANAVSLEDEAWNKFLAIKDSINIDKQEKILSAFVRFSHNHREEAAQILIDSSINSFVLIDVIANVDSCAEEVWTKFSKFKLSRDTLDRVITNAPAFRERAGRKLLLCNPRPLMLVNVMRHIPSLQEQAWKMLVDLKPGNSLLRYVMKEIEPYRLKAAELLLAKISEPYQFLSNEDLRAIIEHAPKLHKSNNVGEFLLKQDPTWKDLVCIATHIPSLKSKAIQIGKGRYASNWTKNWRTAAA
jgi:hypothetical protein